MPTILYDHLFVNTSHVIGLSLKLVNPFKMPWLVMIKIFVKCLRKLMHALKPCFSLHFHEKFMISKLYNQI